MFLIIRINKSRRPADKNQATYLSYSNKCCLWSHGHMRLCAILHTVIQTVKSKETRGKQELDEWVTYFLITMMRTVFFIAHQTSEVKSQISQHAQWRLANIELLSRENAAAQLCQNKLEFHPTVRLFYVFLMTVGWWWGSVAQRHRLQSWGLHRQHLLARWIHYCFWSFNGLCWIEIKKIK